MKRKFIKTVSMYVEWLKGFAKEKGDLCWRIMDDKGQPLTPAVRGSLAVGYQGKNISYNLTRMEGILCYVKYIKNYIW